MAEIYVWQELDKNTDQLWYFWNDVETHGTFDDDVPAGPFETFFDAFEDALTVFNCDRNDLGVRFKRPDFVNSKGG